MSLRLRRTEGATLFVVVLVVVLLLTAVMAVTGQLALSGRRSSGDQENTLRTQYAAESTVARAQARMNVLNTVLPTDTSNGVKLGIRIPDGTSSLAVSSLVQTLCGISSMPAPSNTTPVCGSDSADLLKDVRGNDSALANRLPLFVRYIKPDALRASGMPASTDGDVQKFWVDTFDGPNGVDLAATINNQATQGTTGVIIRRVDRPGNDSYNITLTVPDVNVQAASGTSSRSLRVGSLGTTYVLTVSRNSFAKYALFTNHHFSDASAESTCANGGTGCRITFTSNTVFSGPVHTNQQFNFQGNPYFAGPVTSAGCKAGKIYFDTALDRDNCTDANENPGAYFFSTTFKKATDAPLKDSNSPAFCSDGKAYSVRAACSKPTFQSPTAPITWDADYVALPKNGNDQLTASKQGGIYIGNQVSNMSLSVGTVSGQNGKMQKISYTSGGVTVNLAFNANNQMFIQVGTTYRPAIQLAATGQWVDAASPAAVQAIKANINPITPTIYDTFNGVVYADAPSTASNGDGIVNLNGPARSPADKTSTTSNTKPAVADFAQITIVSNKNVHITSDLKYETPPCQGSNSVGTATDGTPTFSPATCDNLNATNIMGIYSSEGDVLINSPDKYSTGAEAPANVTIQAVLMASKGKITVDGYDATSVNGPNSLGNVNLLGGIIENYYGAFGITDGRGYGRNFVYDPRTGQGVLPPSFPTLTSWTSSLLTAIKLNTAAQVQQSAADFKNNTGKN